MLKSLIVHNRPDIAKIVACVDPMSLFSFTIAGFGNERLCFSRANEDIISLMQSCVLRNLGSLTLTLDSEQDHDLLFDFLETLPRLEYLSLTNAPSIVDEIASIQEFILAAPNLLDLTLKYDSDTDSTHLVDLFTTLALETDLVEMDIYILDDEERMPELPRGLIDLVLERNSTATKLGFTTFLGDLLLPEQCNLILNQNRSLRIFEYCEEQAELQACRVTREESQWKQVNSEAVDILSYSRILASFRHSKSTRLPIEIISSIFTYSTAQSPLWIKEQLDVIFRCLRDRRTIGMVRSEVILFDKNVLFVKCKRALARVGSTTVAN